MRSLPSLLFIVVAAASGCGVTEDDLPMPDPEGEPEIECDIDDVGSCQDAEALCVPLSGGGHGCDGNVDTGRDTDGAIMTVDDVASAQFQTVGDGDLFRLDYERAGQYRITAQGDGVELQLEFYDAAGEPIGVFTGSGVGTGAVAVANIDEPHHTWLVVRHVGGTTGAYRVGLREQE